MDMEQHFEIIHALPGNAEELSAIAFASKAHWGYPPHWMESWRYSLTIEPTYIEQNAVYIARLDGRTAGFYALVHTNSGLELEHLWVSPPMMGKGVGRRLVSHALQFARHQGATQIAIQADPHAEPFYLHMGAVRVGDFVYELEGQTRVLPKMVIPLSSPDRELEECNQS
jgi:GNAT superfamily N-acetyltransferase